MAADKNKIAWCTKQAKGIKITDPKNHLCDSYIKEADETLENVFATKGKWKVITAYYACYNALYSILMKCGIKSEIHDCTIELMGLFEFEGREIEFIRKLKKDRIQVQYYLKNIGLDDEKPVKEFILKCKQVLLGLSSVKINEVRQYLEKSGCPV